MKISGKQSAAGEPSGEATKENLLVSVTLGSVRGRKS